MTAPWRTLLKPLTLGAGLAALALLALVWSGAPPAARAAGPVCTVCPAGGGCDYTDIQAAVDDERCEEIRVAQGVYTGVQARPAPVGYPYPPASGLITQVVLITRTVAVQGGYTVTNWITPDPMAQPTTLDAGGLGRVMVIAGDISPTVEGLGLTNGNAAGLGGHIFWDGGGLYVIDATATLSACRVFSNAAYAGGGLYLQSSSATLNANSVASNTAAYAGGGLYLQSSPATLNANSVASNAASYEGGGLFLEGSPATLISNNVASNTAGTGGGLSLYFSDATLLSNSVISNTAAWGAGGLYLGGNNVTLTDNVVAHNQAGDHCGGLWLIGGDTTLTNTVVTDNWAGTFGSGLCLIRATPRLLHTTIARNGGGDGSGLYVNAWIGTSTAWLTNTILVSQTVGITMAAGCTATMNGTLWYGNGANWGGMGALSHSRDTTGNPAFVDPGHGDYHIGAGSAAINRGASAGVTTDKDGRPRDARPDLGAYEFQGLVIDTYLPAIRKSGR